MLNRKNKLLIITCFTALFFSCSKDDFCNCLKGTGATTTQEREVEPFTDIQMENNVDVIFTQSNIYSLSVTCGSNIIDGIETRVEGSTLYIRNKNKCNWLRDFNNQFTVQVSGPDLNLLTTTGSGNFTNTDTLTTGEIKIESKDGSGIISVTVKNSFLEAAVHTGPADIIISGSTRGFGAYSAGTGFIRASGLASDYAWATNLGTADVLLKVEKELSVKIYHTGDIYYSGNPYSILTTISGSGKLIKTP